MRKPSGLELLRKERLALHELLEELVSERSLEDSLSSSVRSLARAAGAELAYIGLLPKASTDLVATATYGMREENVPVLEIGGRSLTGWVFNRRAQYSWPGGEVDDWYQPYLGLSEAVQSELVTALEFNREVIGLLILSSYRSNAFTPEVADLVRSLTPELALLLQNKRFFLAATKLAQTLFPLGEEGAIAEKLATAACEIMSAPVTTVWLRDSDQPSAPLVRRAVAGAADNARDAVTLTRSGRSVSWKAVRRAERYLAGRRVAGSGSLERGLQVVISDIRRARASFANQEFADRNNLRAMVAMPLVTESGVIGVVNTYARRPCRFLDREVLLLRDLAGQAALALEHARATATSRRTTEKMLEVAQLGNPGLLALAFTHDARHIMQNVNAWQSVLLSQFPAKALQEPPLSAVRASLEGDSRYLTDLFSKLVNYARVTKLVYGPAKLRSVIKDVCGLYEPKVQKSKGKLSLSPRFEAGEGYEIECLPGQIEQVLMNLINNALWAVGATGSGRGEIEIYTRSIGTDRVEISVKDNGAGILEEDLPHVFEPWFSKKGEQGTGFGLAICRRIVEDNHGGAISVKSTSGFGATFFVVLPRKQEWRKGRG